jgi:hypothetical protein
VWCEVDAAPSNLLKVCIIFFGSWSLGHGLTSQTISNRLSISLSILNHTLQTLHSTLQNSIFHTLQTAQSTLQNSILHGRLHGVLEMAS